jgi:hypothetical protein
MLDSCAGLLVACWIPVQVCWLPVGCMLDFLACWFLDEQYFHWFPAGPVDMQRYLPAAGSAGLVTGSAGATCMGLLQGSEDVRGPRGDSSGICLRLGLLV